MSVQRKSSLPAGAEFQTGGEDLDLGNDRDAREVDGREVWCCTCRHCWTPTLCRARGSYSFGGVSLQKYGKKAAMGSG